MAKLFKRDAKGTGMLSIEKQSTEFGLCCIDLQAEVFEQTCKGMHL